MAYTDILPDPNNQITDSGKSGGTGGEGFASVTLTSNAPIMQDRTNSGRVTSRAVMQQKWDIDISYNPMTREQFEPVYNFILQYGKLNPFKVSLPQNRKPQSATFTTYAESNNLTPIATTSGGAKILTLVGVGYIPGVNSTPKPGDLFNVSESNHNKTYRVTRVETSTDYTGTAPASTQVRIHFTPGLSKQVTAASGIIFDNPLIRVLLTADTQQYSLGTDGLYSFSLKLEEAL